MRKGSIAATLFWLSALWLVAALAATAILLTELYSRALDTSLEETLVFHLDTLVVAAPGDPETGIDGNVLADPRFGRPASGWYWQVVREDGTPAGFSSSVIGTILPDLSKAFDAQGYRTGVVEDAFGTEIRVAQRRITIDETPYILTVTGNLDEINELVADFRGQALVVLGAVGVMLAVMSALVARFALRPMTRLRQAVETVREGEAKSVDGTFPAEVAPLADEINELLRSNSQIIERARSQVGNLAHGLKTPLAVLRNEAAGNKTGIAKIVLTETDKMANMVASYLDRARLAARTSVIGKRSDAGVVADRLVRVMDKIHPGKDIAYDAVPAETLWFRGDEADFEEMAGNLIDNACKWSKHRISVHLGRADTDAPGLCLIVEDDGPGLSEEQAQLVLRRGVRLDEKTPGSGLGLDIVMELVDVYGGSLQMSRSSLGGLKAELRLPAARSR